MERRRDMSSGVGEREKMRKGGVLRGRKGGGGRRKSGVVNWVREEWWRGDGVEGEWLGGGDREGKGGGEERRED